MTISKGKIMLVDDDEVFCGVFATELGRMGFLVQQGFGSDILASLNNDEFHIIILDILMPEISGLQLLKTIKNRIPDIEVIMLTGNATIENAIISMKEGAYDFITKPVELDRVEQILNRCMEKRKLESRNQILKNRLSDLREGQLLGNSPAIKEIKSLISRFADSDSTVLIYGESGTGKELVANLIHENSLRREEPFIIVDCTALQENLLESELFGHERGAFTGAVTKKHGIFEIAEGGSVFLDEIGDISPSLQVKLLRVVETRSFRRLGGNERIDANVRLIVATNRDLLGMIGNNEFREDLYYRINVVSISLPPLREHIDDIPLLVNHFIKALSRSDAQKRSFSPEALKALKEYDWPGNARELRNLVERSLLLSEKEIIDVTDLPLATSPLRSILSKYDRHSYPSLKELDSEYIRLVLEKTKGNKQLAAKILKIDRKTISRLLAKYNNEE
ncbi:MAG: sigma-54 dependent transcriptional regulator [candidate division Zixibacteria bacterium]